MCYTKELSLKAFMFGSITSLVLFVIGNNKDRHLALFFLSVALMQVAEYFIHLDENCNSKRNINHYASVSVTHILLLQIAVLMYFGLYYKTFKKPYIHRTILYLTVIMFVYYSAIIPFKKTKLCSIKTKQGHLSWDVYEEDKILELMLPLIYASGLLSLGFLKDKKYTALLFLFGIIPLYYHIKKDNLTKKDSFVKVIRNILGNNDEVIWPSTWCYTTNILPTVFIIKRLFF